MTTEPRDIVAQAIDETIETAATFEEIADRALAALKDDGWKVVKTKRQYAIGYLDGDQVKMTVHHSGPTEDCRSLMDEIDYLNEELGFNYWLISSDSWGGQTDWRIDDLEVDDD